MNTQELRAIFESSGNLRRLHLPQEYTVLEDYIRQGVIHLESNNLEPLHHGLQEQLIGLLDSIPPWEEIAISKGDGWDNNTIRNNLVVDFTSEQ